MTAFTQLNCPGSKKLFLALLALCSLSVGYSQSKSLASRITPRSDNTTPHRMGMIFSDKNFASTMLNPTGWGSTKSFAFVSVSGTPNQLYSKLPDLALRTGVGVGDARKAVSAVAILNVNDVSAASHFRLRDLSYSFIVSRDLGGAGSVSAGTLHLFADPEVSDGVKSFYVAYSYAIKGIQPVTPGNPRLSFTAGMGSGAFYYKAPVDTYLGKGHHATGVFGSVSYDLVKNLSLNAEWTGVNLGLTTGYRLPHNIATIYAGISDLTRYTGDAPTFIFGVGRAFGFKK